MKKQDYELVKVEPIQDGKRNSHCRKCDLYSNCNSGLPVWTEKCIGKNGFVWKLKTKDNGKS